MIWTPEERMTVNGPASPARPRLDLTPTGEPGKLLDGAWWPRSTDPVMELPGLILTLDELYSPVTRLMLRRGDWENWPHRLRVDRPATGDHQDRRDHGATTPGKGVIPRVVRLGWFESLPRFLLTVFCVGDRRVDLLTVPADTGEKIARKAMKMAAHSSNLTHAPDIMATVGQNA